MNIQLEKSQKYIVAFVQNLNKKYYFKIKNLSR